MANVNEINFKTGTAASYAALANKDPYCFYLLNDTHNLYIGEQLLTNAGDLAAAISRIAANETGISSLQGAVSTLNGDASTAGSVRKIVADEVAAIVASADADFDTLKEIADWIISHGDDAAAMNTAITNLQNLIGTIPQGAASSTIVAYISEAIADAMYSPFDVTKPSDLLVIPEEAYSGDRSTASVNFPRALVVEKKAFWDAEVLQTVAIPVAQSIGESAFESCIMLQKINIPSAVYVGKNAYAMCMFAEELNAPLLNYVGNGAFQNTNIAVIDLPSCHTIEEAGFAGSFNCEKIHIPNVRYIGSSGFQDSHKVEELKLYNIEEIGSGAFYDCPLLKDVYIYNDFVAKAGHLVFRQTPMDTADSVTGEIEGKIYVPAHLVDAYKAAEGWSDYADCIVAIPGTQASGSALPSVTASDAGKVLKVDQNGEWDVLEEETGLYWQSI